MEIEREPYIGIETKRTIGRKLCFRGFKGHVKADWLLTIRLPIDNSSHFHPLLVKRNVTLRRMHKQVWELCVCLYPCNIFTGLKRQTASTPPPLNSCVSFCCQAGCRVSRPRVRAGRPNGFFHLYSVQHATCGWAGVEDE